MSRMRLSTPCSLIRSSAGEISSAFLLLLLVLLSCDNAKVGKASEMLAQVPRRNRLRVERSSMQSSSCKYIFDVSRRRNELQNLHLGSGINPQYLHHLRDFRQVQQSVAGGLVVSAEKIE